MVDHRQLFRQPLGHWNRLPLLRNNGDPSKWCREPPVGVYAYFGDKLVARNHLPLIIVPITCELLDVRRESGIEIFAGEHHKSASRTLKVEQWRYDPENEGTKISTGEPFYSVSSLVSGKNMRADMLLHRKRGAFSVVKARSYGYIAIMGADIWI